MYGQLAAGLKLARYRLVERIGIGGMGSVWRANDELLDREVALKILPRELVKDPSTERRFEREARALGRLQHPNVVGIYDIGTADPGSGEDLPFLVMELVRGRPLSEMVVDRTDYLRVLGWFEQVARALAAAHTAGIVHRDLKPSNIMVDDENHVVVLDFGLARLTQRGGGVPEETLTTPGMVLGSCPYMAPEQALGQGVSPASDVFSFGAVLYEALTGARAFTGDTPMRVLQAVVRCEFAPIEDLAPGLPAPVYEIVERCLSRDPGNRYGNAAELGRDLATVIAVESASGSGVRTVTNLSGAVAASRLRRARQRRAIAIAALIAAAAGIAVGLWRGRAGWEPRRPDPGRWSMTEVLGGTGDLFRPAWSPNGSMLAVGRTDGDRGEVLIVPVSGDEPRVLIEGGGTEVPGHPAFSPDSAAVVVSVISGSSQAVQVVPTVGGPPVAAIDNALHAVWQDRSTLVFTRVEEGGSAVWTADLETGRETRLIDAAEGVSWWEVYPRPGGGFALLGGATDTDPGIFVSDPSGRRIDEWLAPGRDVHGADWAPGGRAMAASVDGQLVRLTGRGMQPLLPDNQEDLRYPTFSGDGRLAAVHNERSYDIISVDPDGDGWSCLLCDAPRVGWGSRAADGAVVYRQTHGGLAKIYLRPADGGVARPLTEAEEEASCPVVSPDGTRVAYLARGEGVTELRVRPIAGGEAVTLARDVESSELVSWSPGGDRIAFAGGSPIRVWVVSAAGGEPRAVSGPGGDYPSWSPDGAEIAYSIWTEDSDPDQGTWVVALDGGEPRRLGPVPSRAVWDPRTGGLLQLRRSPTDDAVELWELDDDRQGWTRRARLDIGARAPIQLEYLPFTVEPRTGRLVVNRLSVSSRLLVFDGVEIDRW